MHAVQPNGRALRGFANADRNLIGTEAKKLAAREPTERSRTRGICALRMKILAERTFFHRLADRCFLRVSMPSPLKSFPLLFQWGNRGYYPLSDCLFNFMLIVVAIHGIERLSFSIERDIPARDFAEAKLWRHQLHQHAIAARRWILLAIVVHTRRRVFEDKYRSPGLSWRTAVASLI